MSIYADTGFFVALYLPGRHSTEAERRMATKPRVWITPLHTAEWMHAVSQHVFRKEILPQEALRSHDDFERDRSNGLWLETDLPESVWQSCGEIARRHGAKLGIRTMDSLHVALALELRAKEFWTFDGLQGKLADAEGLHLR